MASLLRTTRRFFARKMRACSAVEFCAFGL